MYKRSKYDYTFRLQCVKAVLEKGQSVIEVANEKGFNTTNLRLWISFYEKYGKDGLKPRIKRSYMPSFKLLVLRTITKEFLSLREACVRFNIPSESVIISWQRAYELKGKQGLIAKPKGRPGKMKPSKKNKSKKFIKPLTREQELLLENKILKAENELLKKLHALVQTDKKQKP